MTHRSKYTAALAAAGLLFASVASASAEELRIFNWADYFGADTVANFQTETGIDVSLDYYDSNEVLETKLLAGGSGYDLVFPATSNAVREFQAGALAEIDTSKLSNYGNLNPKILASLDQVPGGRKIGVPYTWGTVGIAYNAKLVAERIGDQPLNSLDVIFKPEIAEKLKDCGIAVLDSPFEISSVALNYLGADPYTNNADDLKKAEDLLATAAKSVRYFHNQRATNDLASGDICVALIYSGDAGIAAMRAEEAGNGVEVGYAIPQEGTLMWIDLMAIPADAPNAAAAYKFIDYMLKPEVVAEVTNLVYFANANKEADAHVDPAILGDENVYPGDEVMGRLFPDKTLGAKEQRLRTRLWTKVKTGQ
ncbi:MAG: spermidine/putrescine ABC transporter substrate-binding protein PotF [Hyphomicrobiales bacterium]|nr:MAG: spermidine/putrescine ABC transporter substrate-binding protein PotF [Hyphomicrobiales bacterium]